MAGLARVGGRGYVRLAGRAAAAVLVVGLLAFGVALSQGEAPTTPPPSGAVDDAGQPAQPTDTSGEAAGSEEDEPVKVEHADLVQYDPDKGLYFLTGKVHFRHRDANLYCDEAQYDEANDTARAVGHLKLVTPDSTVTGDLITADFNEEVADITGNVRLITQRKPKEATAETPAEGEAAPPQEAAEGGEGEQPKKLDEYREKLTTVTCERIRYWYEEKRAIGTGNIVAVQEDKTCYADEATYLEKEDTLTLVGDPVVVVMENGNRFETPKVIVDVERDRIQTEGGFSGIFKREKKEEGAETQPAEPAPASGTSAPPPPG